jgi:hypothetical protein
MTQSHRNPDFSVWTHQFICGGVERRFSIGFDSTWRPQFISGSRGSQEVSLASLLQVTEVVRRFTSVRLVYAQCAEAVDRITILGVLDRRDSELFIDWRGTELTTVGPSSRSEAR